MPHTKFLSDGQLVPFDPGDRIGDYTVLARRTWIDTYWYQVTGPEGVGVIHESLAYFSPTWQTRGDEVQADLLAAQGLSLPVAVGFYKTYQDLHLYYRLYPEVIWDTLSHPLSESLWQDGMITEDRIHKLYNWIRSIQQQLAISDWCNPSLALPTIALDQEDQPVLLEWNHAVPRSGELVYPRCFNGYHQAISQLTVKTTLPVALCWSAVYCTLLSLIQGKTTRFWFPQAPDWRPVRSLLSREMQQWFEDFRACPDPETWPDLPAQIYRPQADLEAYQTGTQKFHLAFAAYHDRQFEQARAWAIEACQKWICDPWHWYLLSRCEQKLAQPEAAQQALREALRQSQIAVLWRESGQQSLELGQWSQAAFALEQSLELCPQDDVSWYLNSLLYTRLERYVEAEAAIRQACQIRPLNSLYRQHLIGLLRQRGAQDEALALQRFATGQPSHLLCEFTRPAALPSSLLGLKGWQIKQEIRHKPHAINHLYRAYKQTENPTQSTSTLFKAYDFSQSGALSAFNQELYFAQTLKHPHLMNVVDTQPEQGVLCYEWVDAQNLQAHLQSGPIPSDEWITLASQAQQALAYLHAKEVIHGDINPSNLLWNRSQRHLTLIDYDSLHPLDGKSKQVVGHTDFSAPEWLSHQKSSISSDRYSLALSLLQAASGLFVALGRNWKNGSFEHLEPYVLHLPADLRQGLMGSSLWQSAQRALDSWFIPEQIRALSEKQSGLSQAVLSVAGSQDLAGFDLAKEGLLEWERSRLSYYHLAYHALRLNLPRQAIQFAKACLHIDDWHMGARWILADALMALGQAEEALNYLLQAQTLCPDEAETYRRLLKIYTHFGQLNLALAAWQHLKRCLPHQPEVWLEKAAVLTSFGLFRQAQDVLNDLNVYSGSIQQQIKEMRAYIHSLMTVQKTQSSGSFVFECAS